MATQSKSQIDFSELDVTAIAERVRGMSDQEKRDFILSLPKRELKIASKSKRVQRRLNTPDELWDWIKEETSLEIPRVAVCDDHCAPFDFIWDAYSNKERSLLLLASREGGKTLGVSVVHFANAETKPGCEGCTFGAILPQAKRAYEHIKSFTFTTDADGNKIPKPQIEGEPTRSETKWKSGSKVEIIVGTQSGVNSPHPNVVHADEIDLMEDDVWSESRNMAGSKKIPGGGRIPAQDLATSTRKSNKGLMQQIIDETEDAIEKGHNPPWKIYAYCVAEVAEEVPCCRSVDPVKRVRRLAELGRDPSELCECDKVIKGEWAENNPRTLQSVCKGRFFRSRGWLTYEDIIGKFQQNSQAVWDAQMECRRPSAEGLYLPSFTRERYGVRQWIPRPEYGRIWMGVDWGGSAASAILWIQGPLYEPIEVMGFNHQRMFVPKGAYVVFDEIHEANVGAGNLADQVVTREIAWRYQFPGWRVDQRFADMAGKQQRDDWREHDPPLWTSWHVSREFDPTVDNIQAVVKDSRFFVDVTRCPNMADDAEAWKQKKGKEVEDESTHTPAGARYCLINVEVLERRQAKNRGAKALPVAVPRAAGNSTSVQPAGAVASTTDMYQSERWRESIGMGNFQGGSDGWRP